MDTARTRAFSKAQYAKYAAGVAVFAYEHQHLGDQRLLAFTAKSGLG